MLITVNCNSEANLELWVSLGCFSEKASENVKVWVKELRKFLQSRFETYEGFITVLGSQLKIGQEAIYAVRRNVSSTVNHIRFFFGIRL